MMKGRRRPIESLQLSLNEPRTGDSKKPSIGEMAQINIICSSFIPYISSKGNITDVATE